MQFLFKDRITDMLDFAIKQGEFIISTTGNISSGNDFLASQYGMILYNSTCMCLQTIGETLKQIDNLTDRQFLHIKYPAGSALAEYFCTQEYNFTRIRIDRP